MGVEGARTEKPNGQKIWIDMSVGQSAPLKRAPAVSQLQIAVGIMASLS